MNLDLWLMSFEVSSIIFDLYSIDHYSMIYDLKSITYDLSTTTHDKWSLGCGLWFVMYYIYTIYDLWCSICHPFHVPMWVGFYLVYEMFAWSVHTSGLFLTFWHWNNLWDSKFSKLEAKCLPQMKPTTKLQCTLLISISYFLFPLVLRMYVCVLLRKLTDQLPISARLFSCLYGCPCHCYVIALDCPFCSHDSLVPYTIFALQSYLCLQRGAGALFTYDHNNYYIYCIYICICITIYLPVYTEIIEFSSNERQILWFHQNIFL